MATMVRVKYLKPHGDNQHCTYGEMSLADASKLEGKGIVQIREVLAQPEPEVRSKER